MRGLQVRSLLRLAKSTHEGPHRARNMRSVGKTEKPPRGTRIGRFPGAHVFRSTLQAWTARLDDGQVLSVVEGKLSLLEKQAETREINQYCSSKKTIDDAMILREGKEQVKWSCADYVTMIKLKLLTRSKTDRPKMPSKKEDGKSLWETLQNDPDPQPPQPPLDSWTKIAAFVVAAMMRIATSIAMRRRAAEMALLDISLMAAAMR
jgi:hypothetical protein